LKNQISGWRTNAVIAAIIAISLVLYFTGSSPWVFAIAALMIFSGLLGQYFRGQAEYQCLEACLRNGLRLLD
jgi:ABC-type siderophore export system fused ATPase/permease subunit